MALYIGQLHPIAVYRTGVWVCAILVLNIMMCSFCYFFDKVLFLHDFHHGNCDYYWKVYGHSFHFELHVLAFCN